MNKTQALAAMDAHLVRVEAERLRRTERRQRGMLRLYPILKRVPPDQRAALLHEARRSAFTQWPFYGALGLFIAVAAFSLRGQISDIALDVPVPTLLVFGVLALAPAVVLYSQMRGYLRLAIDARNQKEQEGAHPP